MVESESSIHPSTEVGKIIGATSEEASAEVRNNDVEELPMVVWLKGDEDYVDEFCLDAEAAMKEIGIRRSRLTQISGKELRVGRMRIDRYVRPVYRKKDIDEYKKWTRATASHLRSSSVLEQASKKLEDKVGEIESSIEGRVKEIHGDLQNQITEFAAKLESHKESVSEALSASITDKITSLSQSILGLETSLFDQLENIGESLNPLSPDDLDVAFSAVKEPLADLCSRQNQTNEVISQVSSMLAPMKDIRDHLVNDLQEIGPSLGELYTLIYDTTAHIREQLDAQNRYNRKIAEMLAKIIDFQRDTLLKQQTMLVRMEKSLGSVRRTGRGGLRHKRKQAVPTFKRKRP